ncbi:PQQ-like beta-propeller repeat protein [Vicingaceae bacterium]|nr:PQQ-like beta-propeller repeat protein [Vicingaceae bacterium]
MAESIAARRRARWSVWNSQKNNWSGVSMARISDRLGFQLMVCFCLVAASGFTLFTSCKSKTDSVAYEMTGSTDDEEVPNIAVRTIGDDWSSFLGSNRDGKSKETGILTDWSAGKLRVVWSRAAKSGYAGGSVSRGRYFHFEFTEDRATLYCLNAETGESLWSYGYDSFYRDKYGYDNGPRCTPVVDGHRVYIYGAEGQLHCINVNTGKLIWKIDAAKVFGVAQNFFGVGSTPIIHGDTLIVMVGGSRSKAEPSGLEVPNESGVVCFDKRTGEVLYGCSDESASYSSPIIAEINGKPWCFALCRDNLIGFDPATGEVRDSFSWRALVRESVNASTPIIRGDQIFISECYGPGSALLTIADNDKFQIEWEDSKKGRDKSMLLHWNTPILIDGFLYGSSGRGSGNAELRCVDWKTGELQWGERGLKRSSLTYVDGYMIALGEYGDLVLIRANPRKMDIVTNYEPDKSADPNAVKLASPCWGAPIVAKGLMYIRTKDKVVCFELIPETRQN